MDLGNQDVTRSADLTSQHSNVMAEFMGIKMNSPVIAGSCPRNLDFESVRQLISAGVGAIVLPSILQEQLVYQSLVKSEPLHATGHSGHEPQQDRYNGGPEEYLKSIQAMKATFAVPTIASIHGASTGAWLDYARSIQDSGADALEVNWQTGRCDPNERGDQVETRMLRWVEKVRASVTIPIAFKMSQRFTNIASIALKLQDAGVNGLVLFAHRPQWDVDIDRGHWTIGWELSPIHSLGSTLEGLVETRTQRLTIPIAASGGVRTGDDTIKTLMAGADVAMVVSEIYRQGPDAIHDILAGIQRFLRQNHHASLKLFLETRPNFDQLPNYSMRSEIVDPLTSSQNYLDPTPVARVISGDGFGHPNC